MYAYSDLKDVKGTEQVGIEVLTDHKKKPLVANKLAIADLLKGFAKTKITLKTGGAALTTVHVSITSVWTVDEAKSLLETVEGAVESAVAKIPLPKLTLSTTVETHRPWFARASYYYDTSKNVYNYTTSFRVVSPFARFGENTVNTVLSKVSGKTLHDLDTSLVAPGLDSLDEKVDYTLSVVLTKLHESQQYVLKKKDDAVETTSVVAKKSVDTISGVASSTYNGVAHVTSAAVGTVVGVKDYTTKQVVSVSSAAFGTVKGATTYLVGHVPYLGAKLTA